MEERDAGHPPDGAGPRADPDAERLRDLMLKDDPAFGEVMQCVFGLQGHETETYLELLGRPDSSAADLADALDRDRSNVSRSLSTLREKGLVDRRREVLDGGGQVYCYTAVDIDAARQRMHEALDAWAAAVHDRIDEFGAAEGNGGGADS
ncbi:MAG: helix-turn-helix domain-containing protein [Halobacteriaceae archaeon]